MTLKEFIRNKDMTFRSCNRTFRLADLLEVDESTLKDVGMDLEKNFKEKKKSFFTESEEKSATEYALELVKDIWSTRKEIKEEDRKRAEVVAKIRMLEALKEEKKEKEFMEKDLDEIEEELKRLYKQL